MGEYLQEKLSGGQYQQTTKSAPALGELVESVAELLIISISGCAPGGGAENGGLREVS